MAMLSEPARVAEVSLDATASGQRLEIRLQPVTASEFALLPPPPLDWARTPLPPARIRTGKPLVLLDPGHGGIDPGALREGLSEKDIALTFAFDLAAALKATDAFDVAFTREEDIYLGLTERVALARSQRADVFLSLHANTVTEGVARGTALYTLSGAASDAASDALAARENAADLFRDDRITATEDVARVLLDLARRETDGRSNALARDMVEALRETVGVIRSRPHRSAGFAVLKAPDIPSVLIELGFLSDAQDRANMMDPAWRARAADGIVAGLLEWRARDPRLESVTNED
jgi:N-acetylmuramoyl-L-alanine amidase